MSIRATTCTTRLFACFVHELLIKCDFPRACSKCDWTDRFFLRFNATLPRHYIVEREAGYSREELVNIVIFRRWKVMSIYVELLEIGTLT